MNTKKKIDLLWELMDKRLRDKLSDGISQRKLAAQIGIKPSTLNNWLTGLRRDGVTLASVVGVLSALEVPVQEVIELFVGKEKVDAGLKLIASHPDVTQKLAELIDNGGPESKKIMDEINFLYELKFDKK